MDTVLLSLSTIVLIIYTWLRATSDSSPSRRDRAAGGDTHHNRPARQDDMGMNEQHPSSVRTPTISPDQLSGGPIVDALPLPERVGDIAAVGSGARPDSEGSLSRTTTPAPRMSGKAVAWPSWAAFRLNRRTRGLIAGVISLVLLSLALWNLIREQPLASTAVVTTSPTATSTAPSQTYAPATGAPLEVVRVVGNKAGLRAPREAIMLPDRRIAVADTSNGRLVILGRDGRVIRATRDGHLVQPFALASDGRSIYVLDAGQATIERYNLKGRFTGELVRNPNLLGDARGMAVASNAVYVASPRANSIVEFALPGGKLRHVFNDSGGGDYSQPSDVAVNPKGDVYSAEVDNHIKMRQGSGAFIQAWPTAGFITVFPVHVLPLGPGRLLASDPSGALLSYIGASVPVRYPLRLGGKILTRVQPQGLSRLPDGAILIADALGNRLLVVVDRMRMSRKR